MKKIIVTLFVLLVGVSFVNAQNKEEKKSIKQIVKYVKNNQYNNLEIFEYQRCFGQLLEKNGKPYLFLIQKYTSDFTGEKMAMSYKSLLPKLSGETTIMVTENGYRESSSVMVRNSGYIDEFRAGVYLVQVYDLGLPMINDKHLDVEVVKGFDYQSLR